MNNFNEILVSATGNISKEYFSTNIIVNGHKRLVYRERVYCYELYHQIRKQWKSGGGIEFQAEFDKSGSDVFAGTNLSRVKPDFLFHSSGSTKRNFIAMEVKTSSASKSAIEKDMDKLIGLTTNDKFKFEFGIFLIYGKDATNKGNIANQYISNKLNSHSNINIFTHEQAGAGAKAFTLGSQASN